MQCFSLIFFALTVVTSLKSLPDIDITITKIKNKLDQPNPEKSPGNDLIHPAILKNLSDELAVPLTDIFKSTMQETEILDDWKMANVTPIYKNGSKRQAVNYRPINLTSQISKILESVIRDEMMAYLLKHNIIRDTQHGFLPSKSCLMNLLTFLEKVTKQLEEGSPVDVVYQDFSKAFDTVPHHRLKLKLRAHGINTRTADWIGEWLRDRKQRVVVRGGKSSWSKVHSGVLQGSVLGPLLFIIYINDIEDGLPCEILKFADDTKMFSKITCQQDIDDFQYSLQEVEEWSREWQMRFNVEKCKCLHLGYGNPQQIYTVGGKSW